MVKTHHRFSLDKLTLGELDRGRTHEATEGKHECYPEQQIEVAGSRIDIYANRRCDSHCHIIAETVKSDSLVAT